MFNMQEKYDVTIKSFYIFNPKFGVKEGEEEKKVFYYYPPKTDIVTQMKTVGLSEAIIKFTQTFVTQEDCNSVHTLKTRQYFYHAESDYWIVMTINVPYTKYKDGIKDVEYHPENIHDDVYLSVLKQSYDMYMLFVGSFDSLIEDDGMDTSNLKLKLHQFFNRYLHYMNIATCDIIDVFEGMQFLPLDKKTYLHAQSFMNQFQCDFYNQVQYSLLLVKNNVVWSSIESMELRVIYRYLVTNLLSSYLKEDSSSESGGSNDNTPAEINVGNDTNVGRFITCPSFYLNNSATTTKVPKVLIKNGDSHSFYQLLVYNVMSSFICMFIPEKIEISLQLLRAIETFLRMKFTALATELSLHKEKRRSRSAASNNVVGFSYIYFNRLNLAQKNTLRDNKSSIPAEVLSVLTDICFDKKRYKSSTTAETVVKTYDDYWAVGQFCNGREFFIVTQQKNTTLMEISDEMKKICEKQLKSIFFHV